MLTRPVIVDDVSIEKVNEHILTVNPSDTNPCLEIADGGLRVIADGTSIQRAAGGLELVNSPGLQFVSKDTFTNVLVTPDVEITQGVKYMVDLYFQPNANDTPDARLQFGDAGAFDTGANYANENDALGAANNIIICPDLDNDPAIGLGHCIFYLSPVQTDRMTVQGHSVYIDGSHNLKRFDIVGYWDSSETVTRFRINFDEVGTPDTDGVILLYKLNEA